jgi:general secretion pathway protein H
MTSPSNARRAAGFTLLEMLVVIAVMAVILLLVTGYGPPRSHRLETAAAAQNVANALRAARGQAIASGHAVRFTLPRLPGTVSAVTHAPAGGIVFAPDGSASGGQVLLQNAGQSATVTADWLTGQVQIDEK